MKKALTLLVVSIFIFTGIIAQTKSGVISGSIRDAEGFPLPGATLKLDKYNRYTISDKDGNYEFLSVPEGSYNVEVTYLGFATTGKQVEVSAGENAIALFVLNEGSVELGNIVVLGDQLKGQAKALNKQKTNSNISNVISADQVGRFPDSNIGDALKRIPGITMQNDQGEARNIIIRGLAPELNSVTLNGNRIPSAEGDNRRVQMDLIPADMISTVEVSKTLTPDQDADAIGGSVDLTTRSALDKQRISASISGGYLPIREKGVYSGSFIYGNRFFDKKLGATVSLSYQNKDYGSDNIEAVWEEKDGHIFTEEMDIRKYDVQRIRRSGSLALDYKINNNNIIFADIMYNWRDDRENRYRTRYRSIEPVIESGSVTGYTGAIRRQTKGGIDNNRNKNRRLEDQRSQSYALKGQHLLSDKFDLDWNISYSKASEDRPNERYIEFEQKKINMDINLEDSKHPLIIPKNESMDNMGLKTISENHNNTSEDEWAFKINARTPLSFITEQKGRLRFGLRARLKQKDRNNNYYEYKSVNEIGALSTLPTDYFDGKNFGPGSQYLPGTFVQASYLGNLDLSNTSLFTAEDIKGEYLTSNYEANERILAGYVRWDQNITNNLLLIIGARAEHTYIDYTGNDIVVTEENDTEVYAYEKVKKDNSYLNLFPSINVKYDASDNFIVRGAFTTGLARPSYYSLVPYKNLVVESTELSVGNSDLKATYSYNFDLMAEYYFGSVGIISAGVFYKRMNNFIYSYADMNYDSAKYGQDFPGTSNPIPAGEQWKFYQMRNGDKVDLYGFEVGVQRQLNFLPSAFLKNFGIYLNYTYNHSKAYGVRDSKGNERKGSKLPGMAPHMFNASLSWENKKFNARVSLNYTSDYIDEFGDSDFSDSYYDKQLFLDINAAYKVTSQIRIFADANNLTNQPLRYYQGSSDRMKQLEYYKPSFNIGVKCDF